MEPEVIAVGHIPLIDIGRVAAFVEACCWRVGWAAIAGSWQLVCSRGCALPDIHLAYTAAHVSG
jgi:hypothetical protein